MDAYSREPRRVELCEQLRWPLAEIAENKVICEIVDEDPDRWSQSSAGREYKKFSALVGRQSPIGGRRSDDRSGTRYHKANTSPLIKLFLSRTDELIARVAKDFGGARL